MKKCILSLVLFLIFSSMQAVICYGAASVDKTLPGRSFHLGAEDVLQISVWKDETLTKQVVVRPDGKISFPLIGDIPVAGLTVEELRRNIENKVKMYVPDAPVTVQVLQVGSPKIYVVGKVNQPGVYMMGRTLRVMQALAMAGGMTPFADEGDILIIRDSYGTQRFIKFNYSKIAGGKNLEQNIYLQPGDTVVVP